MQTDPSVDKRTPTRSVSGRVPLRVRVAEIVAYRELLGNLIRKELKVKYKNSALGFLWSFLNPLLYLAIFSLVLGVFLGAGLPYYYFYLLSGLLAWNVFGIGLSTATGAIVGNSSLVGKVYFPREILPLSAIGASFIHFLLQLFVLVAFMGVAGYMRFWDAGFALFPAALAVEMLLVFGLGLLFASLNVYFRDVEHFLELALLGWFWMTPIVYASAWVQDRLGETMWFFFLLNPMTPVVLGYQRAFYAQVNPPREGPVTSELPRAGIEVTEVLVDAPLSWYFERLAYVAILALMLLAFGWWVFRRLDSRFAEEL